MEKFIVYVLMFYLQSCQDQIRRNFLVLLLQNLERNYIN